MNFFIRVIKDGLIVKNSLPTELVDGKLSPLGSVIQFSITDSSSLYEFQLWARDAYREISIANSALHGIKFKERLNHWHKYNITLLNCNAVIKIRVMFEDYG